MKETNLILTNIKEVYFDIIKEIQYLERNLSKVIACKKALANNESITSEKLLKSGEDLYESLKNKTLGVIIASAIDHKIFKRKTDYIILQEVLEYRNYLVHEFFKDNDFEKELKDNNHPILLMILKSLKGKHITSWEINDYLVKIFNDLREEVLLKIKKQG